MRVLAHLLISAWLGCVVVFGVSLNDLSNSERCSVCRAFAGALHHAIDENTASNQMQSVTVTKCRRELSRGQTTGGLTPYCSPFYGAHYSQLLPEAQNGHSVNSMCDFLCGSLAARQDVGAYRQSYHDWKQTAQESEYPLAGGYPQNAEQQGEGVGECEMCQDIATQLLSRIHSFHGGNDFHVTPESICREIEACPQLMRQSSHLPATFMNKLELFLQRLDQLQDK